MSPNEFAYRLSLNPRMLSQDERAKEEAEDVARFTGRTIIDRYGNEVPCKLFVHEYSELIIDRV